METFIYFICLKIFKSNQSIRLSPPNLLIKLRPFSHSFKKEQNKYFLKANEYIKTNSLIQKTKEKEH